MAAKFKLVIGARQTSIALAVLGLAFAVVFSLWSPAVRYSEYSWSPADGDQSGRFQLTRSWPEEVQLQADCQKIREGGDGLIFSSGGLVLEKFGNLVSLRSTENSKVNLSIGLPDEPCKVRFSFDASSKTVSLSVGTETVSESIDGPPFPKFDRLETGAYSRNPVEIVNIVTRPWGLHHSIGRALIGALAFSLVSFALLGCWFRGRNQKQLREGLRVRISWQGAAIAGFLFVAAFFVPPFFDDGWVISRVRNFTTTGVFSNLYDVKDAWFPQGNTHELIVGFFVHLGLPLIWLRVLVIALLVLAWELMRRFFLVEVLKAKQNAIWVAAAFYAAFTAVWVLSLRAEVWVVVFSAIAWSGFTRFKRDNTELPLFFAFLGVGVSFSEHQSGWVAVPIGLAAIALVVKRIRKKEIDVRAVIAPVLGALGLILLNQFVLFGPKTVLEGIRDFGSQQSHAGTFSAEIMRYRELFGQASSARLAAILGFGLMILATAVVIRRNDSLKIRFWGLAFICLIAISFTSSKWLWHFGAFSSFTIVFIGLFFSYENEEKEKRYPFYILALPGSFFLVAICSSIVFPWGYLDLITKTWKEFAETIGSEKHPIIWLILIAISIGVSIRSDFGRGKYRKSSASALLAVSFLLLPILSLAWVGYDASQSGAATFVRQNLRQFVGKTVCDDPFFVTGLSPLEESSIPLPELTDLELGGYPKVADLTKPLPSFGTNIWGTRIADPKLPAAVSNSLVQVDAVTGVFGSPGFEIGDSKFVGVAITAGDTTSTGFAMQFFDRDGDLLENHELKVVGIEKWEPRYVKVPSGAKVVRMVISDSGTNVGGWGATTAIYKAVVASQNEIAQTGNFFIGSFESQKYSCIELARPQGGVWPQFRYVTQEDSFFQNYTFGLDIPLESELCGLGALTCLRTPLYGAAEPKRTDH